MSEEWTAECEELLKDWGEKSGCYRWLSAKSEKKYRRQHYAFSVPVIILSTLSGVASAGLSSYVNEDGQQTGQAVIGGVNIFAGILGTLQSFLKVSEIMEAHRIQGVAWSKLSRTISIELALDPVRRQNAHDFLKICRAEYDRLIESSPTIDDDVIAMFKKTFKTYKVSKPNICNGLDHISVYRTLGKDEPETDPVSVAETLGALAGRDSAFNIPTDPSQALASPTVATGTRPTGFQTEL